VSAPTATTQMTTLGHRRRVRPWRRRCPGAKGNLSLLAWKTGSLDSFQVVSARNDTASSRRRSGRASWTTSAAMGNWVLDEGYLEETRSSSQGRLTGTFLISRRWARMNVGDQPAEPVIAEVVGRLSEPIRVGERDLGGLGHIHALSRQGHDRGPPPSDHRVRQAPDSGRQPVGLVVGYLSKPHLTEGSSLLLARQDRRKQEFSTRGPYSSSIIGRTLAFAARGTRTARASSFTKYCVLSAFGTTNGGLVPPELLVEGAVSDTGRSSTHGFPDAA
jgi:hypothetical protein